jgi:hypothetical protein
MYQEKTTKPLNKERFKLEEEWLKYLAGIKVGEEDRSSEKTPLRVSKQQKAVKNSYGD